MNIRVTMVDMAPMLFLITVVNMFIFVDLRFSRQ
jgi:hypothetical protein